LAIASVAYGGVNVWTSHGPYGGHVNALVIDPHTPSTLYAGTSIGVFQGINSGATWSVVNTGLPGTGVAALAIDPHTPSTLYAAAGGAVFRSTNSGANWTATGLTGAAWWLLVPAVVVRQWRMRRARRRMNRIESER